MRTALALCLTLALLGCSSAEPTPEDPTPMQDRAAPEPREPDVPVEAPPLGSTRAKIPPSSVVEDSRATVR